MLTHVFILLSTGSGRHSDAAQEIRLIGCCILLNVVPKTVPLSGSSWSPLDRLSPFGRLASLEAMRLFYFIVYWKRDIVKQPMKKGSFVPKNVPGVWWGRGGGKVGWVG